MGGTPVSTFHRNGTVRATQPAGASPYRFRMPEMVVLGGGEARDAGVSGALGGNGVDAPLHTRGIHNPSSGWVDVSWGFRLPDSSS